MSRERPIRVIKLGGSLLDYDGLVPSLRQWLTRQTPATNVMIVGGGRLADCIRDAFARHELSEEAAHWLCVRLLGVTAELVHKLLPGSTLTDRFETLRESADEAGPVLFQTERFLREVDPRLSPIPLPHTWAVTSDSIAARLAELQGADELVLIKSSLPPAETMLTALAASGYVDKYFPHVAARPAQVRCVDLRKEGFPEASPTLGRSAKPIV